MAEKKSDFKVGDVVFFSGEFPPGATSPGQMTAGGGRPMGGPGPARQCQVQAVDEETGQLSLTSLDRRVHFTAGPDAVQAVDPSPGATVTSARGTEVPAAAAREERPEERAAREQLQADIGAKQDVAAAKAALEVKEKALKEAKAKSAERSKAKGGSAGGTSSPKSAKASSADYDEMTLEELHEEARAEGINLHGATKKDDVIKALKKGSK